MAAHQAPPSLGFSRQKHWSGLTFPSALRESEKWKWSCSVVSDSLRPHGLQPTRLLCPWDFPGKRTGVGCHCLFQYIYIDTRYVTVYVLISTCTFIFPPASTFPLVGLNLFSKSGIQFPFHKLVHLYPLFCFTSMRSHRIFAFLSLI